MLDRSQNTKLPLGSANLVGNIWVGAESCCEWRIEAAVMAAPTPVRALVLPDVPRKLQQAMAVHRRSLEAAGMWEFFIWVRDVEKVVKEGKVASFVNTYKLKNSTARVGVSTVEWSATRLAQVFALPQVGAEIGDLPDLKKTEAEEIFDCKFRWGNETKWNFGKARHHWKDWFEVVDDTPM